MTRRQNFQNIAWFYDIYHRRLLNLDPPYQRRSVWNQEYKDFFIDTILINYPAPAIFIYEELTPDGVARYNVVDGKQRLTTIFEFIEGKFSVGETTSIGELKGKYFSELDNESKIKFWNYVFLVEYLPTANESVINNIFDRINRNVAKLTSQELRHARFSGEFISICEEMTEYLYESLGKSFIRIHNQSRKQMKDIEFVSQLLLLLEEGPKGYSSDELDFAFSERDTIWDEKAKVANDFRKAIDEIKAIIDIDKSDALKKSRFINQADFYSLFGAIHNLQTMHVAIDPEILYLKLTTFLELIENEEYRTKHRDFDAYYQHTRTASNRTTARKERIDILEKFITTYEIKNDSTN